MKRSPLWTVLGWVLFLSTLVWAQPRGFGPFTGGGGLPSGAVYLIVTGTCPAGSSEVSALDGQMLRATLAGNSDVGTTGGLGTITPLGTVTQPTLTMSAYTPQGTTGSPAFVGSAGTVAAQTITWPAGVPAFSGVTLATHTHNFSGAVLATHTHGVGSFINLAGATTGNCAATSIAAGTGALTGCKATAPNLVTAAQGHSGSVALVSAGTPAGTNSSITGGLPAGTLAWPAGVPTTASVAFTPAGTVSAPVFTGSGATLTGTVTQPTFSGSGFDPHPPFTRVIFCQVT